MSTVLQKLLTAEAAAAIVEDGQDQVGGIVTEAADVAALAPDQLLAAHGLAGGAEYVDVVRFSLPPVARLSRPARDADRPWPTFPTGFLHGVPAPVWELSRTRFSYGAEYWRIRADGQQRCLSAYQGAGRGWRGARGWRPPTPLVGARARWQERELPADVVGDGALLTLLGDEPAEGAVEVRPGVRAVAVPLTDVEIFEVEISGVVRGVGVRVLASARGRSHVLLRSDLPRDAETIGAVLVEPGVYEAEVATADVEDVSGVTHELG